MGKNYKLNEEGVRRLTAAMPRIAEGNHIDVWRTIIEDAVTDGHANPEDCVLTVEAPYTKAGRKFKIDFSGCFYVASISIGTGVKGGVSLRIMPKKRVPKPKPQVFYVKKLTNRDDFTAEERADYDEYDRATKDKKTNNEKE